MKWQEDLTHDIKTNTGFDDSDGNDGRIQTPEGWAWPPMEVMDDNRAALKERFLRVRDNCQAILEIGVSRETNGEQTTTGILLTNKHPDTIYIGIDIDDKSYLDDASKNIYTIRASSMDLESNLAKIAQFGVKEFGFIFIDGWHSINAVLTEWEYTQLLAPHGIVGFHDTSQHPGPYYFVKALNTDKWNVEENVCPTNHGIGFAWRK
jgi:predicted O-methyltransferase YrrM